MSATEEFAAPEARQLRRIEDFAIEMATRAGEVIRSKRVAHVETKSDLDDPVSDIDREIERYVRHHAMQQYAHIDFSGEEFGLTSGMGSDHARRGGRLRWHLDPVDGTSNFVHGIPWSSFSLCLTLDDRPIVGVVSHPWHGVITSAVRGGGVRLNSQPVTPRRESGTQLGGALVLTELLNSAHWPGMPEVAAALAAETATLRIFGSSALSLASFATSSHAAVILPHLNSIDHGAGLLIAAESGATMLTMSGEPFAGIPEGSLIAATSASLALEIAELIAREGAISGIRRTLSSPNVSSPS